MTTLLRSISVMNAAWREAARLRHPEIDVDHQMLGLIAAGGPAAALLARHGVNLTTAREAVLAARLDTGSLGLDTSHLVEPDPLPIGDLHVDAAGQVPVAARAQRILDDLPRTWSENDLLLALATEASGAVRDVLTRCTADVDAVLHDARTTTPFGTTEPTSCSADPSLAPPRPGTSVPARRMEHHISAPPEVVRRAASSPELARTWLNLGPEAEVVGRTLRHVTQRRGKTMTTTYALVIDEPAGDGTRVAWQTTFACPESRWDGFDGGYHDVRMRAVPGGTLVEYVEAGRLFGPFRHMVRPVAMVGAMAGMPHRLQNLSFVAADVTT